MKKLFSPLKKAFVALATIILFSNSGSPETRVTKNKKTGFKRVESKINGYWQFLDSGKNVRFGKNRENLFVDHNVYDNAWSPTGQYWHKIHSGSRDF